MNAADLKERLAFDAKERTPDGGGGWKIDWEERFQAAAHIRYLRGSEAVVAARLEGRQPVVVTVRAFSQSRQIETDWRMRDVRRGTVYNIRAVVPTDDRRWIEVTAESGVAESGAP